MAIIRRLNIKEFKVVSFFTEPGFQEEYTGNSWILDPPGPPSGTEDFNGVARTSALLGRIESISVNIGNIPINQFQQLQPNALAQYYPIIEDIGWVELGRSVASLYYEDCSKIEQNDPLTKGLLIPGRLPVSKNYFDLDALRIPVVQGQTIPIVSGEGFGQQALQMIQMYNFGVGLTQQDIVSFGPSPIEFPFLPIMGPDEYLPMIITDNGISRVPGRGGPADVVTLKANTYPVSLRLISRYEIELPPDPNYVGVDSDTSEYPDLIPYDDGKKLRWGKQRRIVTNAFPADITGPVKGFGNENMWETGKNNRTVGECILYPERATTPDSTIDDDDGPRERDWERSYRDQDILPHPDIRLKDGFCEGCPPLSQIPINYPRLDIITQNELANNIVYYNKPSGFTEPNIQEYKEEKNEQGMNLLRLFHQLQESEENIIDPREPLLENAVNPPGYFHILFNKKNCSFDVIPALRDKDGDIPEPIGPVVSYYMKDIRKQMAERFFLTKNDNLLKMLPRGTDGYVTYSDGKSYKELLGESVVMGCGDYYSFDMIPEVFVELYPAKEKEEIKFYRKIIERPTALPWILANDLDRHHDQNYISDIVKDLTVGIPDMDITTWISDPARSTTLPLHKRGEFITEIGIAYSQRNFLDTPSRWKSMMRPIYHMIYENPYELIDPRWSQIVTDSSTGVTSDRGKITQPVWKDGATLGDYHLFRKNFGEGKLIYDLIDDAISDRIYFEENGTIQDLKRTSSPFDYMQVGRIYNSISDVINMPIKDWRIEDAVSFVGQTGMDLYDFVSDLVNKDISLGTSFNADFAKAVVMFTLKAMYTTLSYEYNRTNPDRNSFAPLRVFKKSGVILRSQSGLYFHDKEPCPIIFLGFNDKKIINAPLSELSKEDLIDTIYFNSNNTYYLNSAKNKRVESKSIMKQRIKEYGINPLLDIFYLNIKEKSSENPAITPFRPGNENQQTKKSDWPHFSKGQYPYMFPPLWNEPSNVPNTPSMDSLGLRDGAQWGDLAWRNRIPNIIIPLKDRWSLSIEEDDGSESSYAVLTDKTPILDLYNLLMEMHVKGVSWKKILNYVKDIKSSVTNNNIDVNRLYDIFVELQTVLNKHDDDITYKRDTEDIPEDTSVINNTDIYPVISLQSIDWGILNFKDSRPESLFQDVLFLSPDKKVYIDSVHIEPIDYNFKDVHGNLLSDVFNIVLVGGKYGAEGVIATPLIDILGKNIPLMRNELYKFLVKFNINSPDLSIQPGLEYMAKLVIRGRLDSINGESFESSTMLSGKVFSDKTLTITEEPFYSTPIYFPHLIDFGYVEPNKPQSQNIIYTNNSDVDSVIVYAIELRDLFIYATDGIDVSPVISKLRESGNVDVFFNISGASTIKEIPPVNISGNQISDSFDITFNPYIDMSVKLPSGIKLSYVGEIFVHYEQGNFGKTVKTKRYEKIQLRGHTIIPKI